MKKSIIALLALIALSFPVQARADIFGNEAPNKLGSYSGGEEALADPGTILADATKIVGYLGTKEGVFYDFNAGELCNYAAASIYTNKRNGVSLDAGMLNLDGFAVTVDWNAGAYIPADEVPLMNLVKYLYIGGGVGARQGEDQGWNAAYGLDAQFKVTF